VVVLVVAVGCGSFGGCGCGCGCGCGLQGVHDVVLQLTQTRLGMGAVGVLVHPTMEVPPQWAKGDGSRRRTRPIRRRFG
jgi:hypothetical protein